MDDTTATVSAAFDRFNAQHASERAESEKSLTFIVGVGILAWGIAKHSAYVTIVGVGSLAYWLMKYGASS